MYLAEAHGCEASVTLFGRSKKNKGEEEAAEEEGEPQREGYGDLGTKRVSGLHNLLSRHHRTNGEGVQVPVGDIPQVEGREGRVGGPRSRLQ